MPTNTVMSQLTIKAFHISSVTAGSAFSITPAGQSGSFQQLLAATIYSQYAEPHIRLSGTCEPIKSFFRLYTDASSPDIKFVPIASYEDVRAQTAEVTFAQLCPENYQKA